MRLSKTILFWAGLMVQRVDPLVGTPKSHIRVLFLGLTAVVPAKIHPGQAPWVSEVSCGWVQAWPNLTWSRYLENEPVDGRDPNPPPLSLTQSSSVTLLSCTQTWKHFIQMHLFKYSCSGRSNCYDDFNFLNKSTLQGQELVQKALISLAELAGLF